ncbi:type II toxin-antitoxin system YafQ family toxin [Ochrobactrum quorumnocens]|jgi:mRNA interferase YafQ|uniref:Type II toxin-antitoxin system YafQ family toxin n=1 Tax=Ochrobactrum quorumnocens TaxID=271865 RepID=A0A5N1K6E1_9HYPH|nr:type II toxin-antitoxin system YafQ family toxin [[Ochrobactrum] quorumnocens]KAA9371100.1 type II toxin-antitoxin system YafQ family toxin [[Ochrobactrum] quorumnocens]MBD7989596.1 type II toxin-antitoxin system YafQ family toxin [Ochrobactrum gallinarum]PRA80978.1 type II toxin-antitoxin system mRNA interferase toxin, RelE/StbE family [Ochrobactrum sp. MYb29]
MRTIKLTSRFKKDLKRERKGRYRSTLEADLFDVMDMLSSDAVLPEKYRDHALTGDWKDHRDCHIKPDLVLIYQKTDDDELLILQLVRLGSHSELGL